MDFQKSVGTLSLMKPSVNKVKVNVIQKCITILILRHALQKFLFSVPRKVL